MNSSSKLNLLERLRVESGVYKNDNDIVGIPPKKGISRSAVSSPGTQE